MKTPTITIDGRTGRVFEGEIPETYCFVPEDCIIAEGDNVRVAEGDYIRGRWDVRNMRYNETSEGQHLFPNSQRPIVEFTGNQVRIFLSRMGRVQES